MNIYKGNLVKVKSLKWFKKNINSNRNQEINYGYCSFTTEMAKFCDKVFKVCNIENKIVRLSSIEDKKIIGDFPIDSIERVIKPKSLLRPGYIVETNNGDKLIISILYNESLYLVSNYILININKLNFNDNLESDALIINKIYKPLNECCIARLNDINNFTLIWERSKKLILSKEEIASKFGIDPSNLIIK